NHAGTLAWFRGDYLRAVANYDELLQVGRAHALRHHEATALPRLCASPALAGRAAERDPHLTAGIAILRAIGDSTHLAWSLMTLGWLLQNEALDAQAAAVLKARLAVHNAGGAGPAA